MTNWKPYKKDEEEAEANEEEENLLDIIFHHSHSTMNY